MAAQGRDPQRQDGAPGVRADARRDPPGDPGWRAPLPGRVHVREPLVAASPARSASAGREEARGRLPEGPAGEYGAGAHQPRTEPAEDPDRPAGGAEIKAERRHRDADLVSPRRTGRQARVDRKSVV